MAILNLFEMAALLKLDPAKLLDTMKDVQGLSGEMPNSGAAEGALAVVAFKAQPHPPGVIRVRRHNWLHAFSMKIPAPEGSGV